MHLPKGEFFSVFTLNLSMYEYNFMTSQVWSQSQARMQPTQV